MRGNLARALRAARYLLGGLRTAVPALAGLLVPLLMIVLAVSLIGFPWVPEVGRTLRPLVNIERRRAGRLLGRPIPARYRALTGSPAARVRGLLSDPAFWRDLAWQIGHAITGLIGAVLAVAMLAAPLASLSMPIWWWALPREQAWAILPLTNWFQALTLPVIQAAILAALVSWALPRLARLQALYAESLLRPLAGAVLAERVEELTTTRAEALEAHGAELRRIERDLHDGTQARLVAIALRLGLAERNFTTDPAQARTLVGEAREGVEDALTELRTVIRAIYPPILSDRGLPGAIRALAGGTAVPVTVQVEEDARVPAAVEAAAYFVVAEALTNVTRHSGASHATVSLVRHDARLRVTITDDGKGGADPAGGTGLAGIRRRVAALDGTTELASPPGGPTKLEVTLPCGS